MSTNELINLVNAAVKKDNVAMEQLYKEYYTDVLFICQKFNLNSEDAKDIAQETFITAFSSLGKLQDAGKFKAWLCKIANNKCLDFLKHNNILTFESIDETEAEMELPDKGKRAEDIVIEKEISDLLSGIIEKLPVEQRVTVFMFYYQDYSVKEIAQMYGCSENTVRSRLNYAKKFMQKEIDKLDNKDIKHRCVAFLPFLFIIFQSQREAFACEVPSCTELISQVMKGAAPKTNLQTSSRTASHVTTAAKASVGLSLGKIIAIAVVAVAVITGGIFTAVHFVGSDDKRPSKETEADVDSNKEDSDKGDDDTDNNDTDGDGQVVADEELINFFDDARAALETVETVGASYKLLIGGASDKESGYIGAANELEGVLINTKELVFETLVEEEYSINNRKFIDTIDGTSYLYYDYDDAVTEWFKTELSEEDKKTYNYVLVMNELFDLVLENEAKLAETEDGDTAIVCQAKLSILEGIYDMLMVEKEAFTTYNSLALMEYNGEITIIFDENMLVDKIEVNSEKLIEAIAADYDHKVSEVSWGATSYYFNFAYDFAEATIPDVVDLMADEKVAIATYEGGESSEYAIRMDVDNNNDKLSVGTWVGVIDYDEKVLEYTEDEIVEDGFNGNRDYDYAEVDKEDITWVTINGYEVGVTRAYDFARFEEERLLAVVRIGLPEEERLLFIYITYEHLADEQDDERYAEAYALMEEMVNAIEIIEIEQPVVDRYEEIEYIYYN